ncbi:enoyl-CoA hydratase/isomerase family protein [Baekduia soli]|uniref:Enoyl-CoA hydratase/isomerase family protein n=1 Tax=Baekduia soli TaxID=496014 RepID=A0A5B8U190_9ACTN|nr:enoyl-CoA hydratase/isomerase family protein [Baekduia soli]QEC46766.1 enoyl-CoA hydratase/isomerase family protein [Baekduia soli]
MPGPREVELSLDGRVATLRLNRPERLNAISQSLMDALGDALDVIDAQPDCRVIVLGGNGRAFSAGGDLTEFLGRLRANDPAGLTAFVGQVTRTLSRLEDNPRPVIAAVNGVAVAGGLELILCCDIVVAARGAMIGDGHLTYGVLPGGGSAVRLIRKVPANVATRLLLTGDLVPAEELRDHGLVNEVVDADRLDRHVAELAERIARLSPRALAEVKRVARRAAELPVAEGLRLEHEAFGAYADSPDLAEGLAAFEERRRPEFPPAARGEGRR